MTEPDFLPFCRPTIEDAEVDSVVASLRSGWITSGPKVVEFERLFAEYCGVENAVAVNSGTAALHVALAALDLEPGDEVITASLTWPSAVNVIEHLSARPVFADVHPETLLLDAEDAARRVTDRTRAIVPVHFAGLPADLDAFTALAEERGLAVVEDAAHAVGTTYRGSRIGGGPHPAAFSFHPIKNITTGEGGMVTTPDGELAERLRILRFHGVSKDAWARYGRKGSPRYEVVEPGWKYNMLDIQAALGIPQLAKVHRFNASRATLARRYHELLADVPEVRPLEPAPWPHESAWHLFIVRLDLDRVSIGRDEFISELAAEGVGAGLHFTPVHLHRYYREKYGLGTGDLPATEEAGERILSLPLYPLLEEHEIDRVVTAVRRVVSRHRGSVG